MSTTTDWIQAIAAALSFFVTGIGTLFVVKTLRLQQKTIEIKGECYNSPLTKKLRL